MIWGCCAMHVREADDRDLWNTALLRLPCHHVLQSYEWGEFKARYGWRPRRLLFEEEGEEGSRVRAAASVLQRKFPHLPLSVMYVPKGPALDYTDGKLLDRVLETLEEMARRQRAIFVKIDPDVEEGPGNGDVVARLQGRGWRFSAEQIQFKNTILISLDQDEEKLLMNMKAKTRYNVRLAGRQGVTVRGGGMDDLPLFYRLYDQTAARDQFIIRPLAYYRDAWGRFIEADLARLFLAEHEGQVLAGLLLFRFGYKVWYMYGASSSDKRRLMPNHLLQWEAIRWAKAQGCDLYDMWGAPDSLTESDPLWGVYRFKAGFGGRIVYHIGAYDYATSSLHQIYQVVMPRYLDFLRRRHQTLRRF